MFELVDTSGELLTEHYETLAATLAVTRSPKWLGRFWKVYNPRGEVVRTWATGS